MMKPGKIQEDKNAKFINVCDCGIIHTSPLSDYALMSRTNKPIFIICDKCGNILVQLVDKQGNRVMTNCIQEFDTVGRSCSRISSYKKAILRIAGKQINKTLDFFCLLLYNIVKQKESEKKLYALSFDFPKRQ